MHDLKLLQKNLKKLMFSVLILFSCIFGLCLYKMYMYTQERHMQIYYTHTNFYSNIYNCFVSKPIKLDLPIMHGMCQKPLEIVGNYENIQTGRGSTEFCMWHVAKLAMIALILGWHCSREASSSGIMDLRTPTLKINK